ASSARAPISRIWTRNSPTCRSCASAATMSRSAARFRTHSASAAPTPRSCSSGRTHEPGDRRMGLMTGKRGLVMGVANDHSIAWGIARALAAEGATLAFTYQAEALGRGVRPLAQSVGSALVLPCDVEDIASVDAVFSEIGRHWGSLDFVVHAIAFSDKSELKGRYADTSRENFV